MSLDTGLIDVLPTVLKECDDRIATRPPRLDGGDKTMTEETMTEETTTMTMTVKMEEVQTGGCGTVAPLPNRHTPPRLYTVHRAILSPEGPTRRRWDG